MLAEPINFLKKIALYILLKTPDIKVLPNFFTTKIHKIFNRNFSHEVSLSDLEIQYNSDNSDLASDASEKLDRFGLIVIKGFINRDEAKSNGQEILEYISSKYLMLDKDYHEFDDGTIVQREPFKVKAYDKFMHKDLTLINIRGRNDIKGYTGNDSGLVDIFHVRKVLPDENKKIIDDFKSNETLNKIIQLINPKLSFKSVNFYFNNDKTNPRGLHIDTPTREYKLFLYLTDVSDSSDGPYTYVPKSHKKTFLSILNMFINKFSSKEFLLTDSNFASNSQAIEICGLAGDLIISNQSGVHGGTPQGVDSSRLILVGILH